MRIFQIERSDNLTVQRLKLLYLIPITIVIYLPMALWIGLKEMGNPLRLIKEIKEIVTGKYK
jgi:hypothetical protein